MTQVKNVNDDLATVYDFIDDLIMGDEHWPCASQAISDAELFLEQLSDHDRIWTVQKARRVSSESPSARPNSLEAIALAEPETFQRVLKALYGTYYTATRVVAQVRELASSGPREPSSSFDPTLLNKVIRTQAGKRRL